MEGERGELGDSATRVVIAALEKKAAASRTLDRLARGKAADKKKAGKKAKKDKKGTSKHRRDLKSDDPLKFFTQLQVMYRELKL